MSNHSILNTPGNNPYKVNDKIAYNQQIEIVYFSIGTIVGIGVLYLISRKM